MKRFIFVLILLLIMSTSCNSILENKNNNYNKILNEYSKSDYKYKDLFDGKISIEVIFISKEVKDALSKDIKNNNLREKNIPFSVKNNYPTFLVAFYNYDYKLNNLDEEESIWDITLKLNDKIYKPNQITKLFRSNHKIFKTYFKNNQRFSTFYLVEFNMIELNKIAGDIELIFSSIAATLNVDWRL